MSQFRSCFIFLFILCLLVSGWFVRSEIFSAEAQKNVESISFTIEPGESVLDISTRLEEEQIIRNAWIFRKYIQWKKIDRNIHAGTFHVEAPITLARVAGSLLYANQDENTITLLPGWGLREVADYLSAQGYGTEEEVYALLGAPARRDIVPTLILDPVPSFMKDKPESLNFEGYLRPDTYRVFANASLEEIAKKMIYAMDEFFTDQMYLDIEQQGRSVHEILIMASLLEREVRSDEDRKKVADLFWRRYDAGWAMQADSSVHYIFGTDGDVFTTQAERDSLNAWNTYKYAGFPPGPIALPSKSSIMAAIYPESNDAWYFITDFDGNVHYGTTLDDHNRNVATYLR